MRPKTTRKPIPMDPESVALRKANAALALDHARAIAEVRHIEVETHWSKKDARAHAKSILRKRKSPELPEPAAETSSSQVTPEQETLAEPEAVAPEAITPEAITPEAITPEAITPEAITPEAVALEAVALEAAAPAKSNIEQEEPPELQKQPTEDRTTQPTPANEPAEKSSPGLIVQEDEFDAGPQTTPRHHAVHDRGVPWKKYPVPEVSAAPRKSLLASELVRGVTEDKGTTILLRNMQDEARQQRENDGLLRKELSLAPERARTQEVDIPHPRLTIMQNLEMRQQQDREAVERQALSKWKGKGKEKASESRATSSKEIAEYWRREALKDKQEAEEAKRKPWQEECPFPQGMEDDEGTVGGANWKKEDHPGYDGAKDSGSLSEKAKGKRPVSLEAPPQQLLQQQPPPTPHLQAAQLHHPPTRIPSIAWAHEPPRSPSRGRSMSRRAQMLGRKKSDERWCKNAGEEEETEE